MKYNEFIELSEYNELFSREQSSKENTINLLKDLSIDTELFSRTIVEENTYNKYLLIILLILHIYNYLPY